MGRGGEGRASDSRPPSIPEKAGPAENVMVKEVWGTNALVEWQPPRDNGNSEITGYFVQKADKKTMVRDQKGLGWGHSRKRKPRLGEIGSTGWGWEGSLLTEIGCVVGCLSFLFFFSF